MSTVTTTTTTVTTDQVILFFFCCNYNINITSLDRIKGQKEIILL